MLLRMVFGAACWFGSFGREEKKGKCVFGVVENEGNVRMVRDWRRNECSKGKG